MTLCGHVACEVALRVYLYGMLSCSLWSVVMQKATKVLKTTLERLYEQLHQDLFSSYTSSSSELWLDTTPVDHDSKVWKKKVCCTKVVL